MQRMIMAGVITGLSMFPVEAIEPAQASLVDAADACLMAIDDFDGALATLQRLGWVYGQPSQIDTIARAIAEFGHLGALRTKLEDDVFQPYGLEERVVEIKHDIPVTASRLLDDFPNETFVDRSMQRAILVTPDSARVLILSMQPPLKVCAALFSAEATEPSQVNEKAVDLEDALLRYFPDHEQWIEVFGVSDPMLAIDFHGIRGDTLDPFPSVHFYNLYPERVAEHTEFTFWTGHVFTYFLQDL